MPELHQIQHVFFDLDHTLWDFETNSHEAIQELFAEFELEQYGIGFEKFVRVYIRCNEYCWEMYRENKMKKDLLRHQRFYLALKDFGIINRTLAKKISKRYIEISPYKTALMPGTEDILLYLSTKYKLHIITNGFQEIQSTKMNTSGIHHYFDKIITSEQAGKRKPALRVFEFALNLAKATNTTSVMIGDDFVADIQGSTGAGFKSIWYNPKLKENHAGDHITITHLLELKEYL